MGVKDQAKRLASGASVALATSGLSSCNDNGAVDPLPPPLQCNTVNTGQNLTASATRNGDAVEVEVRNEDWPWRVERVVDVTGATLISTRLPQQRSFDPLGITLRLASETTTNAALTVEATAFGYQDESCSIKRTFNLTISAQGVQVSVVDQDDLPLPARQRAQILLVRQTGPVVELRAHTRYLGRSDFAWTVSGGELDAHIGPTVRWTLPPVTGIYQAELVIDYGDGGLAYDVLLIEVS
jgi:hypothetical protein